MDMEVDSADSFSEARSGCMDDLQRNLEILNSFTVGMEAGKQKKKRKREIEAWLEEVEKTRGEVVELQGRSAGMNIRDCVARLNATVEGLIQEWNHLREMFVDGDERNGENTANSANVSPQDLQRIWACLSIDF
nr:uncharacterized protein LOC104093999 [Ipomoea trifida]